MTDVLHREQGHWSECGRANPVASADALGRPHRSVLSFGASSAPTKMSIIPFLLLPLGNTCWCPDGAGVLLVCLKRKMSP